MIDSDCNNSECQYEFDNVQIIKVYSSPIHYQLEDFNQSASNIINNQGNYDDNAKPQEENEEELIEQNLERDEENQYSEEPIQKKTIKKCNQFPLNFKMNLECIEYNLEQKKEETQDSEQNIPTSPLGNNKKNPSKIPQQNDAIEYQKSQVYFDSDNLVNSEKFQSQIQILEISSNFQVNSCPRSSQKPDDELQVEQEGNLQNQQQRELKCPSEQIEQKQNKEIIINEREEAIESKKAIEMEQEVTTQSKKIIKKEKKQKVLKQQKKYDNQSKNYPGFFKRYLYKLASSLYFFFSLISGENWLHDNYPNLYEIAISKDLRLCDINQLFSIEPLKQKFIESIENDDLLFYILQSEKLLNIQSHIEALCVYHQQLITTGIIKNQTISKKKKQKIVPN